VSIGADHHEELRIVCNGGEISAERRIDVSSSRISQIRFRSVFRLRAQDPGMRTVTRHKILYGVLVVALVGAAVLVYAQLKPKAASSATTARTVTVQAGAVTSSVSASGNLEPGTSTDVNFQTSGTIVEVDVAAGQDVTAGQTLAKLDPATADASLQVAQLNLRAANEQLAQANDALAQAESQSTSAVSASSGSGQGTQGGTMSVASAQASVYSAQASVIQAQSSVDAAQKSVDATTLTAPVSGQAIAVNGSVGEQIGSGGTGSSSASSSSTSSTSRSGSAAGGSGTSGSGSAGSATSSGSGTSSTTTAFATIVDPTSLEVQVGFPETDAVKVHVGQPATVSVNALPTAQLSGSVTAVAPTATVSNNVVTYVATVALNNPPDTLKIGMTASVTVTTQTKDNVVMVQTAAIQTQAGASYVTKVQNGQQVQTAVTVGLQGDSSTEIVSGLNAGDQVVVSTGSISGGTAPRASTGTSGSLTGGGGFGGGGGVGGAGGRG
jgi:macrolide-specific efflux system membrane fusion protein